MSDSTSTLIPPSPAEDDYVRAIEAAPPLPLLPEADPFALFSTWLREASASEPNDPNAMTLSTVDADGLPDARMVLLKDVDARGFVFYTNLEQRQGPRAGRHSQGGIELSTGRSLRRAVRVRGECGTGQRRRGRRLFRQPRAVGADRRLGVRPVAADAGSLRAGKAGGRGRVALRPGSGAASAELVGLPRDPVRLSSSGGTGQFWLHDRLAFTREGEGWTTSRLFP